MIWEESPDILPFKERKKERKKERNEGMKEENQA
jgi:hypothetical protein